jgi:ubiquinone/menaquinone biosynthesis C-methylase UbiE
MKDSDIKLNIARVWDEESGYYDTYVSHGIHTEDEKNLWKEAFGMVIPTGLSIRILDVGCGTGAMGMVLAEMGHRVTGIDLSRGMMQIGEKKASQSNLPMTFQTGDAESPPFEPGSFDALVARHLLWTLPQPQRAVSSWYHILRPGGIVMLIEGIWDDGRALTRAKHVFSNVMARLLEDRPNGERGYPSALKKQLPFPGGVSEEKARYCLEYAGFEKIRSFDLMHIRKNQYRRQPWYQRINKATSYYMMTARKPE